MRRAAKRVAFLSVIVGVLVAASVVVLSWDRVLEEWYIHRLSSGDEAVQLYAAERLVELESVRSIPALIEVVGSSDSETGHIAYPPPPRGRIRRSVAPSIPIPGATGDASPPSQVLLTPLAHCLFRIGSSSCDGPTFLDRRSQADKLLSDSAHEGIEALSAVRKAWCFPETHVERRSPEGIVEAKAEEERERLRRLTTF